MKEKTLLEAIGYSEPSEFWEFCQALGDDIPSDKEGWANLFRAIDAAKGFGFIEVERDGRNIESLQLTEDGKSRLRELRRM